MHRMRTTTMLLRALMLLTFFLTGCNSLDEEDVGLGNPTNRTDKFPFGVASGDVTSSSAVLWTRTAAEATITLEVSTSADFSATPVLQRTLNVSEATDLTVKVLAQPLAAHTLYFYRWRQGDDTSETGTFRTAPAEPTAANVRFVYSGDSDGNLVNEVPFLGNVENVFEVMDSMRKEGADFFVYLGDTVYADSLLRTNGPARTLDEYREAYRDNREISALPDLLRATSTYAIWDDHEVQNDFDGLTADPRRYASGKQAFLEYMPIDERSFPTDPACPGASLFRTFHWGTAVDVFILDERSCRSGSVESVCQNDFAPTLPMAERLALGESPNPPAGCLDAIFDPTRTMLGQVQKARFKDALRASTATFKFVINEVPIQQLWAEPYDRWEGYAAERTEILHFIRDQNIQNVIFLTTDLHANFINEVFVDRFSDPTPVAQEFVAGPIVTVTLQQEIQLRLGQKRVADWNTLLDLAGLDCRELDAFAYGLVEVNATASTATITLKDATGNILKDRRNPQVPCRKTLGP